MMFFRLLLMLAVFAALMYYVFVFLHETGIIKWINRPVKLGKAMIPFYYLFHWKEPIKTAIMPKLSDQVVEEVVKTTVKATKPRAPRKPATKKTVTN